MTEEINKLRKTVQQYESVMPDEKLVPFYQTAIFKLNDMLEKINVYQQGVIALRNELAEKIINKR